MKKKNPSRKKFDVYEFKVEEEQSEEFSNKYFVKLGGGSRKTNLEKFRNPEVVVEDSSPLTKYQFLKTFSSEVRSEGRRMSSISCVDVETSDCDHKCKDHDAHTLGTFREEDRAIKEENFGSDEIPVSNSINHREDANTNPDSIASGNLFPGSLRGSSFETPFWSENPLATGASTLEAPSSGNDQINCNLSELPFNNNPVNVNSDDDGSATCSSDMGEDQGSLEGSGSDHYSDGWEMENINMPVVVSPDYLIYKDLYCTESSLSFSLSCVKLEGVNAYGSKEIFSFQWEIVDVLGIESQWYAKVETALVKLCIRSNDSETELPDGASGIVELKFAVCDPHWSESQEKIKSMDARYRTIWRVLLDYALEEGAFVGKIHLSHSESYYPIFDENFEDVIYPKGDPDAVSISRRDVELLQPETFINDTIIDFYIKYLKNKIRPEDRNKFHFFNSFFFRKLADLDKNPSSASDGRAGFLRVRKWTRKVNMFEKDYVFIPINFNLHWSLIVICHPGEVATFKDEEVEKSLKVPCILHMDSIKGSHKGLRNLFQSYLWEEWKERQPEPCEDVSSKFSNLRFVPLELPQQENSFDCGLFLLHFVELFLEEVPVYFNPFKLTKVSNFLSLDWFTPAEASLKRAYIQKLIYELLKDHTQEIPSSAPGKECQFFQTMENNSEKENGVEFVLERQIAANSCTDFPLCSNDDHGIEIKLLGTPGTAQSVRDSGLVLKELFDSGSTQGSFPSAQYRSLGKFKAVISPIKEDEEIGEQFAFSPSVRAEYGEMAGYTVGEACTTSYSFKSFEVYDTFTNTGIPIGQNEDDCDDFLSSEASSCGSQSRSEVMVDENHPISGLWCPNIPERETSRSILEEEEELRIAESSGSGCSEDLDTHIVEDSQEVDRIADDDDDKKGSLSSCQDNVPASSDHCQAHLCENENYVGGNLDLSHDINAPESVEQSAAKRPRLMLDDERWFGLGEV